MIWTPSLFPVAYYQPCGHKYRRTVDGIACGPFGIWEAAFGKYSLTHVQTGMRIGPLVGSIAAAKRRAQKLHRLDWAFDDRRTRTARETVEKARGILSTPSG